MLNKSYFIDSMNKIFAYSQQKSLYLNENSLFLKNIDKIISVSILSVFAFSTFASSDFIGYLALITFFLTVLKLFLKQGEKIEINIFETFLLLYFLFVLVSLAGSSLLYLSFKGFLKTFTYLGFYFSAVQYFKNNLSKIPFAIFIIALCASSQGIIGLFQNFSQVGEISTWQDVSSINPEDVMTRVYGSLQPLNPNLYGGYLVAALPSLFGSFAMLFTYKNHKYAITVLILSLLTSVSLVLSGCRGAYIGFFVIMLCFFGFLAKIILMSGKDWLKKIYAFSIGAIILFLTTIVFTVSSIRTRIFSIFAMRSDSSTSFRFNVYQSVIQMIQDNWLLGIGVGNQNFREIYGLYMRTGFDALSAYSVYLEIAVESGIFALIAFVAFLVSLFYSAVKFEIKNSDIKTSLIIIVAFTSILAVMMHGIVDTVFFRPQIQFVFWTMVAILSAVLNPKNYNCS